MKRRVLSIAIIVLALSLFERHNVLALESGVILQNARMRNAPSLIGTSTLLVNARGTAVSIVEERNGWYRISVGGREGWTAAWLIAKSPERAIGGPTETAEISGRYVADARLRAGPGISFAILKTYPRGTIVRILETKNGWHRVTRDGIEGWTAAYLIQTVAGTKIIAAPSLTAPAPITPAPVATPIASGQYASIVPSKNQGGVVPPGINMIELNTYWRDKVNALRQERGLRLLALDQRWVDTASDYASYVGATGEKNHGRPDGISMHQWIDKQGLRFTARYSPGGWQGNYFTENLSGGVADGDTESVKRVLDRGMEFFLAEAAYAGPHYKTIYHQDWNSMGLGFYFKPRGDGRYDVSVVYHYGSLML